MRYAHPILWAGATAPLLYLIYQVFALSTGAAHHLGGDPAEAIMSQLGRYSLWLLFATLAITPLRWINPTFTVLVRSRRMLGLWVAAYAVLHLASYFTLILGLDLSILWQDISQKPYAIAGAVGLLLLIPLAITSTQGWQRKLGRRWKKLHQASYLVLACVWIHFVWQVRVDYTEAAVYLAIGLLLLAYRTPIKSYLRVPLK